MNNGFHKQIELIESGWSGRAVLVVGDVMLDKYVHGTVERISPEAPVPVVCSSRITHCPGGAANVAMNIAGLGAKVTVVGFVGEDEDAATLKADLIAAGVNAALVCVAGFPTTSKLRILSSNQQMLRVDCERIGAHPNALYERLIEKARGVIPSCSAVVLSDYAKGALDEHVCAVLIKDARTLGIPVLVDPKSPTFEKYRNATTICPNLKELALVAHDSGENVERLLDSCERYLEEYGLDFLTVTLAEKGMAVVRKGERKRASAVARQVFDVSGAGDTVIATVALCLACGLEAEDAMDLANVAAGIVVGKVGTSPIDRSELVAALSADLAYHASEKIVTKDRLVARVTAWRDAGERIVFTNGCFDLLHVGHIRLLERAHQQGDRLIVAVNGDESIRRLKGPTRPVVSEHERAKVLAALSAVDAVVMFNESTPLELIRILRPNVLVKGGDYAESEVVGAADVKSWGGRVCLVPLVEGFSTSGLIAEAVRLGGV